MNDTKLQNCISEWLSTTRRNKWEVLDDGTHCWLVLGKLPEGAEGNDWEKIPHYAVANEHLAIMTCCHDLGLHTELKASDPLFFDKLAEVLDRVEAGINKPKDEEA